MHASPAPRLHPSSWPIAVAACLIGAVAVAAIWTSAAMLARSPLSWMAMVAALDAIVLLRLVGMPGRPAAALLAALTTLATIVLANWLIIATHMGKMIGLPTVLAASRLGHEHALAVMRLTHGPVDLGVWALAVLVAILGAGFSGRRRAP